MKILFSKNSFAGPISGADEIVVSYALELKGAGHSPSVLLVHPPTSSDSLAARLHAAEIPVISLASPAFSTSLGIARNLAIRAMRTFSPASKLIRSNSRKVVFDLLQRYHEKCCQYLNRNRPDVVHVMTPDPGAVMLIRAAHAVGVPVVYQEVGIPFDPPGFEEVYERFVSVLPLCNEVAVLSPTLARLMRTALPQLPSTQVLPLISLDNANGSTAFNANGTMRFGFAARLEYLKGPIPLVEGFRIASDAHPAVQLKIAGEGSLRQQVVLTLRKHGLEEKCHFSGVYSTVKERYEFMRNIDAFVLPSLTEGTPNVIIEAMAHAKPIIATAVGGIPDIVTPEVGILVPRDDTKALGAAMALLARNGELRRKMGVAARRRYEQLFTPAVVMPLLVDFYKRVIGVSGSSQNGQPRPSHPWLSDGQESQRHTVELLRGESLPHLANHPSKC